jgi:hypothetical protein
MSKSTITLSCLFTILLATTACNTTTVDTGPADSNEKAAVTRVGTYDSRGVALAYGRSKRADCMLAKVDAIKKAHDKALHEGDATRMKALTTEATTLQKEIHLQVFSGAPIDDILALIQKDLPAIAKSAKVDMIAHEVQESRPGVEIVDVTMAMCAPFDPDAKTKKMISELMSKPPVPASTLKEDH